MRNVEYHGRNLIRHPFFLAFTIIIGVLLSYYFVSINFSADNDVANSAIVWHEIEQYGFSVLSQWRPTPDNWYFSTYPIHFLIFELTGSSSARIIKFIEIFQVFLAAFIATLICYRKTQSHYALLLIPFFCGLSAFAYSVAYISHPFSHNLTNVYGLLCIYLYMVKPKTVNLYYETRICALILIASISDPWFQAAYYLPLFLTSIYSVFLAGTQAKKSIIPLFITGIILFTHLIERTLHLPVARFSLGSPEQMLSNAYWFLVGLGGSLNFFFVQTDNLNIFSSIIIIILYFYALMINKKRDTIDLVVFLSLAGITSAFILSNVPGAPFSARFFVNIIYLSIIVIFTSALINTKKWLLAAMAILFMSGVYSHWHAAINSSDRSTAELHAFLEKNKLYYGFGPYWGSKALAITWDSGWKINIRPVSFDKINGFMKLGGRSQSFDYWYIPENNEAPQRQFIALASEGEECPNLQLCLDGVVKQFGEPAEKLIFNNILFYIYNRPIIAYSVPELTSAGDIQFGWEYNNYIWQGWDQPEPRLRWTDGRSSEILLHQASPWHQGTFLISATSYQPLQGTIFYNGVKIKELDLQPGEQNIHFNIDNQGTSNGEIKITFSFDAVKSQREMGIGTERKKRGLAFKTITYSFN